MSTSGRERGRKSERVGLENTDKDGTHCVKEVQTIGFSTNRKLLDLLSYGAQVSASRIAVAISRKVRIVASATQPQEPHDPLCRGSPCH